IIGAGQLGQQLAETVQHALWTGFHIVAIWDDSPVAQQSIRGVPVTPMPAAMDDYLATAKKNIDEIWLALPLHAEKRIKSILHDLRHQTITTRLVLESFGIERGLRKHSI